MLKNAPVSNGSPVLVADYAAPIKALAFSPDGSLLVTADVDKNLKMLRNGAPLWEKRFRFWYDTFRANMYIRAVAFSLDGKVLYLAIGDNLRALDAETGAEMWRYRAGPTFAFLRTSPLSMSLSSDGALAVAYDDARVEVWRPHSARLRPSSAWKDNDAPNILAYLDSNRIVGSDHISICVWDAEMGTKLAKHVPGVRIHGLAAAGSVIATRSLYDVTIWSDEGEKLGTAEIRPGLPTIVFSPGGDRLAAGDAHGVSIFDLTGAQVARLDTEAATIAMAFVPGSDE